MRSIENCEERLKSIVVLDKQEAPQKINRLLKSELLYLLKNYFEICAEDLNLDITINQNGKYEINIFAISRNMKIAHIFNK